MYESYEDQGGKPWWTSYWAIAAALGVVVAVIAAVLLWPSDGDAPTGTETPGPDPAQSTSKCGLPDGDQEIPTAGPNDAEWVLVDGFATPRSGTFGPGEETDGIHSCFAHNPTGALLAVINTYADGTSRTVNQKALVETRYLPEGGYQAALDAAESATPSDVDVKLVGFRVTSYGGTSAAVDIVVLPTETDLAGQLIGGTFEVRWSDGDWMMVAPPDGRPKSSTLSSLAGYTEWSADGSGEAPAAGSVRRPAPSWAAARSSARAAARAAAPAAACPVVDIVCEVGDVVTDPVGTAGEVVSGAASDAASSVASGVLDDLARQASEAADWALTTLLTAWMQLPDPDVTSPDSVAVWLTTQMEWLIAAAMIASFFVAGYRLAITGKFDHARELLDAMIRVTIVSGLVGAGTTIAMQLGDEFSQWVFTQVDLKLNLIEVLGGLRFAWVILSFGLFVLIVQLIQLALMFVRAAMVPLLVFGLTLSAAGSNTTMGRQAYQKQLAWLIAFVLFKPTAALIYAVSIKMISTTDDVPTVLGGLMLMLLGVLALPGLMRLIVPATAAMSGGNAGALAGAAVGAALATGAVVATGGAAAAGGGGLAGSFGSGGGLAGAGGSGSLTGGGGAAAGSSPSGASLASGAPSGPGGSFSATTASGGPGPGGGGGGPAAPGLEGAREVADAAPSSGGAAPASGAAGGVSGAAPSGADVSRLLDGASQVRRAGSDGLTGAVDQPEGADEDGR